MVFLLKKSLLASSFLSPLWNWKSAPKRTFLQPIVLFCSWYFRFCPVCFLSLSRLRKWLFFPSIKKTELIIHCLPIPSLMALFPVYCDPQDLVSCPRHWGIPSTHPLCSTYSFRAVRNLLWDARDDYCPSHFSLWNSVLEHPSTFGPIKKKMQKQKQKHQEVQAFKVVYSFQPGFKTA